MDIRKIVDANPLKASAPCRVDLGGTLDLPAMHYPLKHISPCTFNIALDMRTRIKISPYAIGKVKISSKVLMTPNLILMLFLSGIQWGLFLPLPLILILMASILKYLLNLLQEAHSEALPLLLSLLWAQCEVSAVCK